MARLLILVSMTLTLAGCFPAPVTYFKPSAPNALHTSSTCAGASPEKDVAVLSGPQGIVLRVQPFTPREGAVEISVRLYIPPKSPVSVRFTSGTFLLMDEVTKVVHEYRAKHVFSPLAAGRPIDIQEPLSGTPSSNWPYGHPPQWFGKTIDNSPYGIPLSFKDVQSKQVRLRIPPLVVGAQTFEFPDIDIREVTEWVLAPFNC